jgi:hypothetical protein
VDHCNLSRTPACRVKPFDKAAIVFLKFPDAMVGIVRDAETIGL